MKSKYRKLYPNEYRIWKGMRARCNASSFKNVGTYQTEGIKVCTEWNSFDRFFEDMGERPPGMSIDRIDNSKDYCKENCRWADWNTQSKNRGNFNLIYNYKGTEMCLKDIAKLEKISYTTLRYRVVKLNLSLEEALSYKKKGSFYKYQGEEYSVEELCSKYNIPKSNFYDRIYKGWSIHKIINTPVISNKYKI